MLVKADKSNINIFQKKLCEILDSIIDIFEKYNLTWYAEAGTLLGCVRDKKIIDWDDDIDIILPIKDYIKFINIAQKELPKNLKLNNADTNNKLFCLYTRVCDCNTTLIKYEKSFRNKDRIQLFLDDKLSRCVYIDIYGLEHMPEKHTQIFKQHIQWSNFLQDYLCKKYKHPELLSVIDAKYTKLVHKFFLETLLKFDEAYHDSEYVCCHNNTAMNDYEDKQYKAKWYESTIDMDFKYLKHKLKIPVGYKYVLFELYGEDYMIPKLKSHVGYIPYDFIFDVDSSTNIKNIDDFNLLCNKYFKGENDENKTI